MSVGTSLRGRGFGRYPPLAIFICKDWSLTSGAIITRDTEGISIGTHEDDRAPKNRDLSYAWTANAFQLKLSVLAVERTYKSDL
ncbi:uncharacterized protein PHALS_00804 [Plasmopara halstedii]|uniref:Uncharacterized protein n=1 Tax=Plasmopara halstedii TaxID=4781 RepID=A0A0P1ASF3_PLAHL|nr:uncharacterized protein PHALS_00804 [Plasmopara halstedii]CEG44437.1 hypothetical protein PHALS_00804 [Plasmopara halstedii]|eukprot:XP_024580806.1 hypothetical protein PHALS_00804 [Plasmopara halstedii]